MPHTLMWFTPLWSGICKRGRQEGVSLICSDLFWKQIGTNRKKTEQIGTNRGIPENKERKSEENGEIGTNRKKSGWPLSADPKAGAPIWLPFLRTIPSTPKVLQYKKKFLRGINFVKTTKNIFQSTRLPEERMRVTEKIGGRNEFP